MPSKPLTLDAYLESVPDPKRAALEALRRAIHAAVPDAEEGFSYGLPAFRIHGKPLAAFAATAGHCSFYPMSGQVIAGFEAELKSFETSKGTIHFQPEHPIPVRLLRRLLAARLAEITGAKPGAHRKPEAATPKPATVRRPRPKSSPSAPVSKRSKRAS
ncbi:MAG: DUF1801 domain-containing protein [Verrucomicrobiales bacterium]|nr:DUF1801 domain-containing protein [Verrucomicrobiales bacterium]